MRFFAVLLAGIIGLSACGEQDPFPAVPLPELGDGPVTLRVVRAVNPRFTALTEAEITDVLKQTAVLVQEHFGLDVRFERGDDYTMAELFQRIPDVAEEFALSWSYTPPPPTLTPQGLIDKVVGQLKNGRTSVAEVAQFVEPLISGATEMGTEELAAAITEIWVQGLRRWHGLRTADGKNVVDHTNYHQFAMWDHLGYGNLPFDVVITNQLVASAELYGFAPHAAMRGGLTNGATGFSRTGQFSVYALVSTFPFANDLGAANELGPDPVFDATNTTRYTALILAHEIGHFLLHLGHPWDNPSCIMFPVPPGGMTALMSNLDPNQCSLGSEPAMTPDAIKIRYNRDLLGRLGRWGQFKAAVVKFIDDKAGV